MINGVLETIEKYGMLDGCEKVVVGLSGGADSVCLTAVLCSLREKYGFSLEAAHINHGIRGEEAQRDEDHCRKICEKLGVELQVLKADVPSLAKQHGLGEEECGRKVRYEFFSSLAGENGKIATAHNLNDNAETLIFNLVRGSGLKGACGIPPVRDNIIRPLINTERSEIERYCNENSLDFVTDSTNSENAYSRNKIRNAVMPILRQINPNVESSLAGFTKTVRETREFFEKITDEKYSLCVKEERLCEKEFSSLELPVKKEVAARFLKQLGAKDVSSKHIDDFCAFAGSGKTLVGASSIRLVSRNGFVYRCEYYAEPFSVEFSLSDSEVILPFCKVKIEHFDTKDLQNLNKDLLDNLIDCDKISDVPVLRSRKDGDSFTSGKRNVTKSLKKLFNEDKIPVEERNGKIILDIGGECAWIDGYATAKKYRINSSTQKAILIKTERGE